MTFSVDPTRILLVEDDLNDLELINLAFESYNFANQIDIVTDGEQALQFLLGDENVLPQPFLPRLMLLDLKLPKVSGIEVLQQLRAHPRTRNMVIVVMTSSREDSDLKACYDLGVNSYVVKPLDFQQFTDVTQQIGLYWMLLNQPPAI
ncbi:MAG: response regulator [Cyanobacteria bacterium P01_A01_bin.37]